MTRAHYNLVTPSPASASSRALEDAVDAVHPNRLVDELGTKLGVLELGCDVLQTLICERDPVLLLASDVTAVL